MANPNPDIMDEIAELHELIDGPTTNHMLMRIFLHRLVNLVNAVFYDIPGN
jgi:hypothetical protein